MIYEQKNHVEPLTSACSDEDWRALDKVFVRNLVLPVRLGVWRDEKRGPQEVRFSVDIGVERRRASPSHLDDVISYDFIVDGIKRIVDEGHVLLVETLAERVAVHCLSDGRACLVRVVVEKISRIPGACLGVEIVRGREGRKL